MHRLRRVAFVTDRGRHQAIEGFAIALLVRCGALRQAQLVHVGNRFDRRRPQLPQQFRVAGVAIHAVDQEQEFAGAVVLRHGIRAAPIDATRHLAVGELIARVPLQEFLRVLLVAETQQHLRGHGAVADPRALVRPRSRLNSRTVAVDQHVRERGAQRVGERLVLRRYSRARRDSVFRATTSATASSVADGRDALRRMLRQVEHDLLTLPGLQIDVVHQCTRREAAVVVNARAALRSSATNRTAYPRRA